MHRLILQSKPDWAECALLDISNSEGGNVGAGAHVTYVKVCFEAHVT